MRVAPPETPARSGVLYRLGLKSDLTESFDRIGGNALDRDLGRAGGASSGARRLPALGARPPAAQLVPGPGRSVLAGGSGAQGGRSACPPRSALPGDGRVRAGSRALPRPARKLRARGARRTRFSRSSRRQGQDGFVAPGAARPPDAGAPRAATITVTGSGGACARAGLARRHLRSGARGPRCGRRRSLPRKPARPGQPARNAEPRQPRRPRGLSLRRRSRRDGTEALRRDRGAEGAGRGRANLRPGPPRTVRGRGLRHLPGPEVPGLRRSLGRGSALDGGGRRHARARPRLMRASSPTRSTSRPAGASPRTSRTSSPAGPCRTSSRSSAASFRPRRSPARSCRATASGPRTSLEWRGYVLRRLAPRKAAVRAASLETAQKLAGRAQARARRPRGSTPAAVYPSLVAAFELSEARALQLTARDEAYFEEPPSAARGLSGAPREAYEFLLRFRFAGDALPPADRDLTEEEYGGLAVLDRPAHARGHGGLRAVSLARGLEPLGQGAGGPDRAPGRSRRCRSRGRSATPFFPAARLRLRAGRPRALVQGRRPPARVLGRARPGRSDLRAGVGVDGVGAARSAPGSSPGG